MLPLVQAVFGLVLAAVVLRGHFRSLTHRLFSAYLLMLALWGVIIFGMRASPDLDHAYSWERWIIAQAPFGTVLFYHFSVCYTNTKIKRWLFPSLYATCVLFAFLATTGLVFSGMQIEAYGYAPIFGPGAPLWILFLYTLLIMALLNFIRTWGTSPRADQRNRAAYITTGMSFSLIGGVFDILPALGMPLYTGAVIGNLVFCLLTTVAVVKHSLLDIRIVFRKGSVYAMTSIAVAIPFIGLFLLVTKTFAQITLPVWAYLAALVIIALLLPNFWRMIQERVDRLFYRDRHSHLKSLETFVHDTQSLIDPAGLGSTMVNLVAQALRCQNAYILQPVSSSGGFTVVSSAHVANPVSDVVLKANGALVRWLDRSAEALLYEDLDLVPQLQGLLFKEKFDLECVGADLIVPLKTPAGYLSGILILAQKLSHQPYTVEDKQLIHAISSQMAIKLDNLRLYRDAVRGRENLQAWFSNISDCVIIASMDGEVQFMNEAAMETFGKGQSKTCWSVLGKLARCADCPVKHPRHMHSKASHFVNTVGSRHYEAAVAPLRNPDGSLSVVEVLRDVTQRKLADEELISSREELRSLSAHLQAAREEERTEIAREIHDELGQALTALKMDMFWLSTRLPVEQEALLEKTKSMSGLIDVTSRTVRRLASELRPGLLDDLGLVAAIEWQVGEFQSRTTIKCGLTFEPEDLVLDRDRSTTVFRILQEALTNVGRHAEATRVKVSLKQKDTMLVLRVKDNGKGVAPEQVSHHSSFGLIGIRERARACGGDVRISGAPDKGTTLVAKIPLK